MKQAERRKWTKEEDNILISIYANNTMDFILNQLSSRNEGQIRNRVNFLKLKKDKDFLKKLYSETPRKLSDKSKSTQFKKGIIPWNKGLKGWNKKPEIWEKVKDKIFKKGNIPKKTKTIGAIRWSNHQQEFQVKIAMPNVWISQQAKIWLDAGNIIPEGHKIVFKDGNRKNLCLENLECLCFANLLRRNTERQELPNELSRAIRLTNKLTKIIQQNEKNK